MASCNDGFGFLLAEDPNMRFIVARWTNGMANCEYKNAFQTDEQSQQRISYVRNPNQGIATRQLGALSNIAIFYVKRWVRGC
jgi:hypothetical protein